MNPGHCLFLAKRKKNRRSLTCQVRNSTFYCVPRCPYFYFYNAGDYQKMAHGTRKTGDQNSLLFLHQSAHVRFSPQLEI